MKVQIHVQYNPISFSGLLTVIFVTLKLLSVISWGWWLVLSPLWIGFAVAVSIAVAEGIKNLKAQPNMSQLSKELGLPLKDLSKPKS